MLDKLIIAGRVRGGEVSEPKLFTTEAIEATRCPEPSVPDLDCWLVVACCDGERWSVRSGEYMTEGGAKKAASQLALCWSHRHVVHIRISGRKVTP